MKTKNPFQRLRLVVALALLAPSAHTQTLIFYKLNNTDAATVAGNSIPSSGTLGNGVNGGAGITLTNDIPTNGVPPGYGSAAIVCNGGGGILAPGTLQLNRTNIANAGGFTYETWFKWNGGGNVNAIIDYAGTEKLVHKTTDAFAGMEVNATANYSLGVPAASNQWHYAAVVFTAVSSNLVADSVTGNFTFYLDTNTPTATVSNVTITSFGDTLNRTIGVGMHPAGFASDYFNGLIYAPRVTLGALPATNLLYKKVLVVTTAADYGPGSLRQTLQDAPEEAVITFAPSLSGQTITLGSEILLGKTVTIDASTLPGGLTISGNKAVRIFELDYSGLDVTLVGLTLVNGYFGFGAAIYNSASLTLKQCTLAGNSGPPASGDSGAGMIYNIGSLTLTECTLASNSFVGTFGGAISSAGGAVTLTACTFVDNSANSGGAVAALNSSLIMTNCLFADNTAASGVGPDIDMATGTAHAIGCLLDNGANSTVTNLFNFVGYDASPLSPLGNYGGSTPTILPLPGSLAIDDGFMTPYLTTDQRGLPRLRGAQTDIGAVELGNPVVTNSAASGSGSLNQIVAGALPYDYITFAPGLAGTTLTPAAELPITNNLYIVATNLSGGVTISGGNSHRIISVQAGAVVTLSGITFKNGNGNGALDSGSGGAIDNQGSLTLAQCTLSGNSTYSGGAIDNESGGSLTLNSCTLSGNDATNGSGNGGAIDNNSTATLAGCTLTGNSASSEGGAIDNESHGSLTLNSCTLTGNAATNGAGYGGAIINFSTAALQNCTLAGNSASDGGALVNQGSNLLLMQSTLSSNSAVLGGAVLALFGTTTLEECTLAGNSAADGGAIGNRNSSSLTLSYCTLAQNFTTTANGNGGGGIWIQGPSSVNMVSCIIAGNTAASGAGPDLWNDFGSVVASDCLIGVGNDSTVTNGVAGNQAGSSAFRLDAHLAPLGNYGGPTQTMPPLPGSPAVDQAGNNPPYFTDQRGFPRLVDGAGNGVVAADVGAVESQFQFVTTSADDGSSGSLRQAVASCPTNGMIAFAPGLSGENLTLTDEIVIDHNLFIDATALPGGVTVSGGGASIFNITNNQSALSRPTVYISHLLVTGNSGNDSAIENYHSILTLDRCTFTNNASAIFNYLGASMTVNQCTIAGNGPNGGITSLNSSLVVNQSTIVGNTTTDTFYGGGGGITSFATSLSLSNSIVASNTAPSSEPQNVFSSSIDTFTFTNNLTNGDPHLAPIGNYGGPLPTMPPLPGSPAIDAGNDSAASQFTTDQRGYSRLAGAHVDIGAVEQQSPATNAPVLQNIAWSAGGGGGGGANTFQFTFTNAPNTDFTVLTATNVALPLTNWTVLGEVMQPTPGQYQFTDRQAATNKMRFYRVRSP